MSKIGTSETRYIAELARLGLGDQEIETMTLELGRIVGYVEQLQATDTKGVPETNQVTGLSDVWRPDVVTPCPISRQDLLKNAPMRDDGYIKVRRVLD